MIDKIIRIIYIVWPIFYLIYNIVCYKKKKVIYTIDNKKKEFIVLDDKYYNMQLLFSTVSCVLLIIESITLIPGSLERNSSTYIIFYALTFAVINYLLKWISFKRKYAKLID